MLDMRKRCSLIVATIAVGCLAALPDGRAQVPGEPDPCLGSKTEAELAGCRDVSRTRSRSRLDRVFAALASSYAKDEPAKKRLLQDSQAAWMLYRDAQCRLVTADNASGSAAGVYIDACLTRLNDQRADDLDRLAGSP